MPKTRRKRATASSSEGRGGSSRGRESDRQELVDEIAD